MNSEGLVNKKVQLLGADRELTFDSEATTNPGSARHDGNSPSTGSPIEPAVTNGATVSDASPDCVAEIPEIDREELVDETINVGAGGPLVVSREELDDEYDDGDELDVGPGDEPKIRKPGRREWIKLLRTSELPTRILVHKPKADAFDEEHYFVAPNLRGPIVEELKAVRVFLYRSITAGCFGLWIVKVTPDNPWYESVRQLLNQPAEFFENQMFRVLSDKSKGRYRVKFKPCTETVTWPDESMEILFGKALGADRFITSADHPLYQDLVSGADLK